MRVRVLLSLLAVAGLAVVAVTVWPPRAPAPAPAPASGAAAGATHLSTDLATVDRALRQLVEEGRRARLRALRGRRTVSAALQRAVLRLEFPAEELRPARRALAVARRLVATRGLGAAELATVLARTRDLAAAGRLHADRLPAQLLTVRRNVEAVRAGTLPSPGERMTFPGDPVVYQRYAGEGLQIQWLGTWGRANWTARRCVERPRGCPRRGLAQTIDRLAALGSSRGGFTAWEYRFGFGGGTPPWVSAITQATAAQALARAGTALEVPRYHRLARRAIGALATPPPVGVRSGAPGGPTHYLMYSFAPGLRVLNGHVQSLVGLYDVAALTHSRLARRLFRRGQRRVGEYDTGFWSLYSAGGAESTLAYHQLAAGFMENLCERVPASPYCAGARRFVRYEHEPPRLGLAVPARLRAGRPVPLRLAVSKVSAVSARVEGPAGATLLSSARLAHGAHAVAWVPRRPGGYRLVVEATDLAGNRGALSRRVDVRPTRKFGRRSRATRPSRARTR